MFKVRSYPWLSVAILAALLFVTDAGIVLSGASRNLDLWLEQGVQSINFGYWGYLFVATNWVSTSRQVIGVALVLGICWLTWRNKQQVIQLAVSWLGVAAIGEIVKALIERPRPNSSLVHVLDHGTSSSFPSGHSIFYTWLGLSLILLISPHLNKVTLRTLLVIVAILLILVGCLGRVWAGAHWPSDVLAGFFLSSAGMAATLAFAPVRK